ncbi:MAG TPA: hypothetical protein VLV78_08120 [Thermoanaerobaculia bacterium]|nr:hypothetical protein [Thermoanaerobaculia bacterium]
MKNEIVFFHVKSTDHNPMTKSGYTSIQSQGKLIVYCTDDGPLDPQYRTLWLEWRKKSEPKPNADRRE